MIPIPRPIIHAPHKRLLLWSPFFFFLLGPFPPIIKPLGIPNRLVHELRHPHGMRSRTRARTLESPGLGIRHVRHMIGRVQILPVPAGRKPSVDHDPGGTGLLGEIQRLGEARPHRLETGIRQLTEAAGFALGAVRGLAYELAEPGAEGGDFRLLLPVRQGALHVVDRHAAVGALEARVADLWHAVVGPVARAEKEHRRPVVGEVLGELAGRARRELGDVFCWVHCRVECVLLSKAYCIRYQIDV